MMRKPKSRKLKQSLIMNYLLDTDDPSVVGDIGAYQGRGGHAAQAIDIYLFAYALTGG